MNFKRQETWNKLSDNMAEKRTRSDQGRKNTKRSTTPHQIIVQRLASDADTKQVYKPIEPRRFVEFDYKEFTLANLKRACGAHYNLPASSCDVLVTNKGPSCTDISQIPHRKDKVYFIRFVESLEIEDDADSVPQKIKATSVPTAQSSSKKDHYGGPLFDQPSPSYPKSLSISHLLKAGKYVKPIPKVNATLYLESFDVANKEWKITKTIEVQVDKEKFAEGGFRSAYKCTSNEGEMLVLKKYHPETKETITGVCESTVEVHARKQVQMHAVSNYITNLFSKKIPSEFGRSFTYNKVYYAKFEDEPVTIEEFVPGKFTKYVNNDGSCVQPREDESEDVKNIFLKAQCLVHMSYVMSNKQLMLLDIQGAGYSLYDPEMATKALQDNEVDSTHELYFCCGNLSETAIKKFLDAHECNKYCEMLDLDFQE